MFYQYLKSFYDEMIYRRQGGCFHVEGDPSKTLLINSNPSEFISKNLSWSIFNHEFLRDKVWG